MLQSPLSDWGKQQGPSRVPVTASPVPFLLLAPPWGSALPGTHPNQAASLPALKKGAKGKDVTVPR